MRENAESRKGFFYVLQEETRILYVDDDPILREFASVNLASEQATVATAGDGLDALEQLAAVRPDIMLLDLEMPRMDGFELLGRLRADEVWSRLPVIVATGREDIGAIDRAFELGATSFVVKPMNWRLLGYQIRYVLRSDRGRAPGPFEPDAEQADSIRALAAIRRDPRLRTEASDFAQLLERAAAATRAPER
jgi:DNA-binding response OmpR family regulator